MSKNRIRLLAFACLVLIAGLVGASFLLGALGGEQTASAARMAGESSFLPAIMRAEGGPMATPSPTRDPNLPTLTPTATFTPEPSATPTEEPAETPTPSNAPTNTPEPTATNTAVPNTPTPTSTPDDDNPQLTEYRGTTNQGKPVELTVSLRYERITRFKIETHVVCNGVVYEETTEAFSGSGYPIENRQFEIRLPNTGRPDDKRDVFTGTFSADWQRVNGTWLKWAVDDNGNILCSNSGTWSATRR